MKICLSSNSDQVLLCEPQVIELSWGERMRFSAKRFGFFLGLAGAAVFIPVFHFVLVPLFLLIAFRVAYKALKIHQKIVIGTNVECLNCKTLLDESYLLTSEGLINCKKCFSRYIVR